MSLLKDIEALFAQSEQRVLAAFPVSLALLLFASEACPRCCSSQRG